MHILQLASETLIGLLIKTPSLILIIRLIVHHGLLGSSLRCKYLGPTAQIIFQYFEWHPRIHKF